MIIGDHNQNYNFYEKDKKTKLKCMLCGKEWLIESNNSIIETISGYTFYFDSKDCSTIFKRLNHVYGNYFVENIIDNIQYISDPFLHNNFSSEEETINEENGETKPPYIKVINNPKEAIKIAFQLVQSAKDEILLLFSTYNAFYRSIILLDGLSLIKKLKASNRKIQIKIISPHTEKIEETANYLKNSLEIDISYLFEPLQFQSTIMIVDRCHSLCVELINDDDYDSIKAMGLSTYSNSKSTVSYYLSVFEILWKQTDIYQKVEELYKELKYKNETQLQLINITAHELRSPIQPILGLSEVMLYNQNIDTIQKETMLNIIIKNAKKIQLLTANILEFASIEEQLASSLEFQEVDLLLLINTIIEEIKFLNEGKKLNIIVESNQTTNINLVADKNRLSQVFLNLISNSVKHVEGGNITISITKKNKEQILIHVIDEGMGIPLHIQQKLFLKFVTGSKTGNGLGLFICKNIIERHGGHIWAKNNKEKGATFSIVLPITQNTNLKSK